MIINENNKIITLPYLWKENASVDYILRKFLPPLRNRVESILAHKSTNHVETFLFKELPNNDNILNIDELSFKKTKLIENLKLINEILNWKKPIVVIADSCFTNKLLINQLKTILGIYFEFLVEIVNIDYEDSSKNEHISDYLYNNSIVILGGSYSDTYTISDDFYKWDLFNFIKKVSSDNVSVDTNNKIIGVCFWQQYINNIMWIERIHTEKIATTIKGVAQFWFMPFQAEENLTGMPYIYKDLYNSLTNYWKNKQITSVLTRTWHVDFNLLNSFTINSSSYVKIFNDIMTWSPIIWGTKNWNILWTQAHFEIDLIGDTWLLWYELEKILPLLKEWYWEDVSKILDNIHYNHHIKHSLWEIFYISSLYTLSESLLKKYEYHSDKNMIWPRLYKTKETELIKNVNTKIQQIITLANHNIWYEQNVDSIDNLRLLDEGNKLRLLTMLDWKVDRWMEDISKSTGFRNLSDFIDIHKKYINWLPRNYQLEWQSYYIHRDLWAWNWNFVREIDKKDEVYSYWVWDFAYFDLYSWLRKLNLDIPDEVLKILVQEILQNIEIDQTKTYKEMVTIALDKVNFSTTKISDSSMFSDITHMYDDQYHNISTEMLLYISQNKEKLHEIKENIKNNFYQLIDWYFNKVLISDFNSLYIKDEIIKTVDFQTAIRSTSHVDGIQLSKILYDYIMYSAKHWSIFIDDWVVRSYSKVPRITEYLYIQNLFPNIKIYFVYDLKKQHINSAVILKEPFVDKSIIEWQLLENNILLDIQDVANNTFFKLEKFYRDLITSTFKTYSVFSDIDQDINQFLKYVIKNIKTLKKDDIKNFILRWINSLIFKVNKNIINEKERYQPLPMPYLWIYIKENAPEIEDILNWNINIPEWFNIDLL